VIVGPAGVFTVETKSRRGRLAAERLDERWLKQAYAQAKWLERAIERPVVPLLVFSRAFLAPAVSRRRGVMVLPARMIEGHLARRSPTLTENDVQELQARLDALQVTLG
jgi:hypothetical protein